MGIPPTTTVPVGVKPALGDLGGNRGVVIGDGIALGGFRAADGVVLGVADEHADEVVGQDVGLETRLDFDAVHPSSMPACLWPGGVVPARYADQVAGRNRGRRPR